MSLTREAELALLIAEQEVDDQQDNWRGQSRVSSFDAPLRNGEGGTWADVIGEEDPSLAEMLGDDETFVRLVHDDRITDKDIAAWRYARYRRKWTYAQIAEHFGSTKATVKYRLTKPYRRDAELFSRLEARLVVLKLVYENGARLIDIAADIYQEVGYASPESCYQRLRVLFQDNGVQIRPKSWKHGARSRTASDATYRTYLKEQNAKAVARRRATLMRCTATTNKGTQCRRLGPKTVGLCENHAADRTRKWTAERVCEALRTWTEARGVYPRPRDWKRAEDDHPTFNTVYHLFGSWTAALSAAELTEVAA